MSILPIIDFLILVAWSLLGASVVLKAVYVTTLYRPSFFGMGPMDCAVAAGILLLLALTLVARSWVKSQEPGMMAARRVLQVQDASARAEMFQKDHEATIAAELKES